MDYPNIDPGPAFGRISTEPKSITAKLRNGTVRVFYKEIMKENCCGEWFSGEIQWVEWAFGGDVHDLSISEKDAMIELIEDELNG